MDRGRPAGGDLIGYADESIRGARYRIAVVVLTRSSGSEARRSLKRLASSLGKSNLHFNDLLPDQRQRALREFADLPVAVASVFCHARQKGESEMNAPRPFHDGRRALASGDRSGRVVPRLAHRSRAGDGRAISDARRSGPTLHFRHAHSRDDPLLWIADGVAHAAGTRSRATGLTWLEPELRL